MPLTGGLEAATPGLSPDPPTDGLVVRLVVDVEGTVDVLLPAVVGGARLGRDRAAVVDDVVLVPDEDELATEPAFVGEAVGDFNAFNLEEAVRLGVGLITMLSLFPACDAVLFAPIPTLLGLLLPAGPPLLVGFRAGLVSAFACSKIRLIPVALRNMPWLGSQSK